MFPDLSSTLQAIFRWFHIIAGITWIGHLYFFNFVNIPFQGGLAKELKPQVNPPLILRALYFFRWGAMWTFLFGLALVLPRSTSTAAPCPDARGRHEPSRDVDPVRRPARDHHVVQRVVHHLAAPEADPRGHARRARRAAHRRPQAALASKINVYLSGPMLWGMVAGSHVNLWDMNVGTLLVAIVIGVGFAHGLYATSRKVPTTI